MWVTKQKAIDELGLTSRQIEHKMATRWKKGVHFAIIDRRIWIDIGEVQEWITREASGQCD